MTEVIISAADVKNLRETTGAGMMDCKKALVEANGDFEKAIEVLRLQGQKLSLKRADRDAKEGVVIALINDAKTQGIVVRVSCETDFVSKNEDFVAFVKTIANIANNNFPADKAALEALPFDETISVSDKITEQVGVIGEKIEIADYQHITAPMVTSYIHMGNKAGVIVGLSKADAAFEDAGKDVAMQIAAMKPVAVDEKGVSSEIIEKEIEIGKELARQEGKPEEMLEKIALGKLAKFYKENTLLPQAFVKNNKQSVAEYLHTFDKGLTVTDFKHVKLG